jgi:hypothetical protein
VGGRRRKDATLGSRGNWTPTAILNSKDVNFNEDAVFFDTLRHLGSQSINDGESRLEITPKRAQRRASAIVCFDAVQDLR